jgi:hypothetical protein
VRRDKPADETDTLQRAEDIYNEQVHVRKTAWRRLVKPHFRGWADGVRRVCGELRRVICITDLTMPKVLICIQLKKAHVVAILTPHIRRAPFFSSSTTVKCA